jgi:hypothetical protein
VALAAISPLEDNLNKPSRIGCSPQAIVKIPYFLPEKSVFKTAVQEPLTERPRNVFCINALF